MFFTSNYPKSVRTIAHFKQKKGSGELLRKSIRLKPRETRSKRINCHCFQCLKIIDTDLFLIAFADCTARV